MTDWFVARTGTHGYILFLEFDESDDIHPSDLDSLYNFAAFRGWLESIRTSGAAVGFDADSDITYSGRLFQTTIEDDDGDDQDFDFRLELGIGAAIQLDDNDNVDYFYVIFNRVATSPDISAAAFISHLHSLTIEIDVDSTMPVVKQTLEVDQVVASTIKSGDSTLELINGVPIISRGEHKRVLGTGHGVQLHMDELPTNSDGDFLISTNRDYEILSVRDHSSLSNSGDEDVLVLQKPSDMLRYGPTNRSISIEHPLKYDRAIDIRYWDDTAAFWLRPGENVLFRWIREEDGSGRIEATNPPDRLMVLGGLEVTVGNRADLEDVLRITGFESGITAYLIRNPLEPTTSPNRVDLDGFSLEETEDYVSYTLAEWEALDTQFNMDGMWKASRNGLVDIELRFDLFSVGSATGTLSVLSLDLWTKLNAATDAELMASYDPGISLGGQRTTIPFALERRRFEAVSGQLFYFLLKTSSSPSMAIDQAVIAGHQRNCVLSGELIKEE